ncbi:(d)CMP kinase [Planctomyces sp. SH-PL14]|uniref:(d)CMP kinase n=1 Tax=Planctomyces sp. SH-PL14 TaxID=1632864 RepID=UPI00078C6697|nr:(d)CMP kinase [Planctomyces sp. SH-PL14]AMV17565.1 Cytidylate kinase [Planctomyces sp. SH-PL14]
MIVTIDGPAGTGKSTAARRLAEQLGFQFLDTGAMYRVVALRCLEQTANPESDEASGALARSAEITFEDCRTFLGGRDVSHLIRETNVTQAASLVARNPSVRSAMVELQRAFATGRDIVTEGRDQGTVVFPMAELKLYLTADPVERARRRFDELRAQGQSVTIEELLEQQGLRDQRDQTRDVAPLRAADDAVVIDTTSLSIEQVLERMLELVTARRSR